MKCSNTYIETLPNKWRWNVSLLQTLFQRDSTGMGYKQQQLWHAAPKDMRRFSFSSSLQGSAGTAETVQRQATACPLCREWWLCAQKLHASNTLENTYTATSHGLTLRLCLNRGNCSQYLGNSKTYSCQ